MDPLRIRLLLDDSSPLSPDDAGGCALIEGRGREARTDYCRADVWLAELADGLSEFQTAPQESWVDFSDERESLRLVRRGDQLVEAEYRGVSWTVPQDELVAAVADAADELLRAFSGFAPFAEGSPLSRLETWRSLRA